MSEVRENRVSSSPAADFPNLKIEANIAYMAVTFYRVAIRPQNAIFQNAEI